MLSAALLGFFLLLDFLVSLVSTAPRDILAVNPSSAEYMGLPTGVALLEFAIFSVSIVLALAVLVSSLGRPLSRSSIRLSPSLALGTLAAVALVGTGAYMAFSGILGRGISYDEHLVERSLLESGALVVLASFFFSLAIAGIVNRKLLVAVLAAWLIAGFVFGLLDTKPLNGLYLFERPTRLERPSQFTAVVESYMRTGDALGELEPLTSSEESESGAADGEISPNATILENETASQDYDPAREPVFRVAGAAHTRYLRVATGDVYDKGEWRQLDMQGLPVGPGIVVADAVTSLIQRLNAENPEGALPDELNPELLAYPLITPVSAETNRIMVVPAGESSAIQAGAVPISKYPVSINTTGTYNPFSATLTVPDPVSQYEWWSSVPRFSVTDLVEAEAATGETYLQLPDDLPERIHQVAEQFKVSRSPYLKAYQIMLFLEEELTYEFDEPEVEPGQPPAGSDPVDWFLFEQRVGGAGNFSSAFVALARAAGIPARVVSGWVIEENLGPQVVYADQSHQWAEIALEGVGWITFDPGAQASRAQEFEEPTLEAALEQLAESEDPTARAEAAQALGLIGDTTALPGLVEAMEKDSDMDVRQSALTAVQRLDFDVLVWILLTHEDSETRAAAARALSALRDLRAIEPFFQALSGDESPQVRVEAARGLAHIGRNRAEGQLLLAATVDEDATVRAAAVRSLGKLKATWTARQLVSILDSDTDSQVREASALALGEIRAAIALRPLLEARSEDEIETVRLAAGRALRMWSSPGLLSILQESREARERAAAAELLGERKYTTAIPALSSALYDPNDEARSAALAALGNMGELTWLENGNGLLRQAVGDFALIPGTTAERTAEIPRTPVFELEGGAHTSLLRVAVGDYYVDGKWLPKEHLIIGLKDANVDVTEADVLRTVDASSVHRDEISISGADFGKRFLPGSVPISIRLESVSAPGTYWPNSATYALSDLRSSFTWASETHDFSTDVLSAADRWPTSPEYPYAELQDMAWLQRARELAANITDGQTTTYGKANAIEQYLKSEYTYRFADTNEAGLPPPGRDPVDWFLFESLEGASGNFSSAFVILARLVGIPSRVVSGWAVIVDSEPQTICSDQAHQWAEVAFDGPGWVAFDPTPGGAPFRAGLRCDPADRERALWELERRNYSVTRLENGSVLIDGDGQVTFSPGTTTRQSPGLPHVPVFNVSGAANTSYLRTAVGDTYSGGYWTQLDPVTIPYSAGDSVPGTVRSLYSSQSGQFASLPEYRRETESLFGFLEGFDSLYLDRIRIDPAGDFTELPAGLAPASLHLQSADRNGAVYPFSSTFSTNDSMETFSWTAEIPSYSAARYAGAAAASDPTYTQLPEDLPERIRELALTITAGHATTYAKAKALERYLATNYTYALADPSGADSPPPGRDPIDWFLFDHREGTCGVFSSAFVVLARSVGIPARVVSGWAISATGDTQTVYLDQAHQWAEVAFEGLGWVKFEPTAAGGAPSRTDGADDGDGNGDAEVDGAGGIGESGAGAGLGSDDPAEREAALEELEEQGADVTRLENGGAFIDQGGQIGFSPGTTTLQAGMPPHIPVFNVSGAAHTSYLRTSTGDVYENGGWRQLNPINVPYVSGKDVPGTVRALYDSPAGAFASLPSWRRATASLFGFGTMPQRVVSDLIQVYPAGTFSRLPYGALPTSLLLRSISLNGVIHPFSSTFSTDLSVESFSWFADIPSYSAGQHNSAVAASDFTYTQLPSDLPARIRQLAMGVTAGHSTPYGKAKALERYLKTNYTYRFADPSGADSPPPGRDPMDWFLFDHREGTCGIFSSAFVVLARSIGIPARVVSGWAIAATGDTQTVYTDQAHQWAEVAFDQLGWVSFEPTASGGAPSRAPENRERDLVGSPPPPLDTITTITQWPSEVRRQTPFIIGGAVTTVDGQHLSGMQVEIYVNETKEHGGDKIGTAMTTSDGYEAEVTLPANMNLGDYQLLARTVGTDDYYESWSDPDITVFSGSGLELTGPAEITVDIEATFLGRLSEDTGRVVTDREVTVTIDGIAAPSVMTDSSGQFALSRTFSSAGSHWVEVEVQGGEFLLDNTARLNFQVTLPTETVLHAPAFVEVGEEFRVTGELRDIRGMPLAGEHVYVQIGEGPEQTVVTDASGFFQFTDTVYTAGEFTVMR